MICLAFCACAVRHGEPVVAWYRDFTLLPSSEASAVMVLPSATRQGYLDEADWRHIVDLLSRLKAIRPEDKVISGVITAFKWPEIVAVQIDLADGRNVTFVKNHEARWEVVGIGSESIPHYAK